LKEYFLHNLNNSVESLLVRTSYVLKEVMKHLFLPFILIAFFSACKNHTPIVGKMYVDSLVQHFSDSKALAAARGEIDFWQNRIDLHHPGISNEIKYAGSLIGRFHLTGDIHDVQQAEKELKSIDSVYAGKEAVVYRMFTETALLQHQFQTANMQLQKAKQLGIENYVSNSVSFDVSFELGDYNNAVFNVNKMMSPVDYGYHFRKAKLFHLYGKPDSAAAYMMKAAALAPENSALKGIALANAGDFYIHTGKPKEAAELFKNCIRMNANDVHSIMALGSIAMKTDHDYASAEKLFNLAKQHYQLPDPLFKLYQLAQVQKNKADEKKFASQFASVAVQPMYGKMYTKYLIELYTGVLNQPALAEQIAANELNNRSTPQTAAWYAYALYNNNKIAEAEKIYKTQVAGKPLEGLELFYMGKLMKALNKSRTAHAFFKAADENRFDLSPGMAVELDELL